MRQTSEYDEMTILIVEDDEGHAMLVREHLEEAGVRNSIIRFKDGEEAWKFLTGSDPDLHRRPGGAYLMLLDIRMPRMDGVELLKKLKANPELQKLPVIMLTTTDDPREVEECYRLGCNSYIAKPLDFKEFTEALRRLGLYIQIIRVAALDGEPGKRS